MEELGYFEAHEEVSVKPAPQVREDEWDLFTVREGYRVSVIEYPGEVFEGGDEIEIPVHRAMEMPWVYEETFDAAG